MDRFLFITIDTEEDDWGSYDPHQYSVENISSIPRLQAIFNRYDAIPTYLINYPVATNKSAVDLFNAIHRDGRCEIGSHLHPWNTPPFVECISSESTMLCNLPEDIIASKIKSLHHQICDVFQTIPECFRSGRWGFSNKVAKALIHTGYTVDTSITPFVDWRDYHGPNFSDARPMMYRLDPTDILNPSSKGSLIEVPPTIGFFQNRMNHAFKLYRGIANSAFVKFRILGLLDKLKLLNFRWLCPELTTGQDMKRLARNFISQGCGYLNMSFHSTTLLPGASPYVNDERTLEEFLNRISSFLEFATKAGFSVRPLSDATKLMRLTTSHFS